MKKLFAVLAATLVCGAGMLTSCGKDKEDGKNIAYNLIDGQWVQEESEYDEYFVDGNLMITRWKLSGRDEERQNCIIESYDNGTLIIKEVVVRGDKLYTETSTLKKQ